VLSGAAKRLVAMFVGIGVLVAVGYGVIGATASSGGTVSPASAAQATRAAYRSLSATAGSYQAGLTACQGSLRCVQRVDARMSRVFGACSADMRGVAMPTAAATTAAVTMRADATRLSSDFGRLSTASSPARYRQAGAGLSVRLFQFAATFRGLAHLLGLR
jgi:hypothetical protein